MTTAAPPADRLEAATLAADPVLARRIANMKIAVDGGAPEPSKAWLEDIESSRRAARVRVRRVLAALNGIDVENETSPWTEAPAIMDRRTVADLCEALCDETTYAAVEKRLGPDRAAALMGVITSL